jgi:hypothetical protein
MGYSNVGFGVRGCPRTVMLDLFQLHGRSSNQPLHRWSRQPMDSRNKFRVRKKKASAQDRATSLDRLPNRKARLPSWRRARSEWPKRGGLPPSCLRNLRLGPGSTTPCTALCQGDGWIPDQVGNDESEVRNRQFATIPVSARPDHSALKQRGPKRPPLPPRYRPLYSVGNPRFFSSADTSGSRPRNAR